MSVSFNPLKYLLKVNGKNRKNIFSILSVRICWNRQQILSESEIP